MYRKDQNGLNRYYKEEIREAKPGELVKIITDLYENDGLTLGTLIETGELGIVTTGDGISLGIGEYVVLTETDDILIGNTSYRLQSRKPVEGDCLVSVIKKQEKNIEVEDRLTVIRVEGEMITALNNIEHVQLWNGEYRVIEQIKQDDQVKSRILNRFDAVEKSILASDVPLADCFKLILEWQKAKSLSV